MTGPIDAIKKLPAVGVIAQRETGRFLLVSALVGVGVGLGAVALVLLLEAIAHLTSGLRIHDGSVWILLTVPVGFFLAWWLARSFAPEIAGDGVPEAATALAVTGGHIRKRVFSLKIIATALTVGSGGSAGREGPIVHIGGSVGSVISRWFRLGEDQVRSLVAAGAGAGIGAAFNAPIAGMLFALEVILGSFATRHMSAIVIASVTAAVTSRTLLLAVLDSGEELVIQAGRYQMGNFMELFAYAAMALAIVVIGVMFLRTLDAIENFASQHNARLGFLRPVGAGLLVAGLIMIEPRLFGTGQEVTNALLNAERLSAVTGEGEIFWWVLILLALGKAVATSLTISSGASGGAFMPSLFMGAAVGTAFARIFEPIFAFDLEPGAFAVVGMAAMFAVVARAPLTAILIVFEITGARDYGLILPLMLTAVLGTFLADRLSPDSVYSLALKRKGIRIRPTGDVDLLDTIAVNRVMRLPGYVAQPDETLEVAAANLARHRSHGTAVVGDSGLVGIITVTDINRSEADHATVKVQDVMTPRPVTVVPSSPVSHALERMAVLGVGRLPVVDEHDPTRLVGLFRREDAVRAYHEALGSSTDAGLERARLAQRVEPGAGYYDFRIPPGSVADGRKVGEVSWPEGSTLVSVRRDRQVLVPDGSTVLQSGDVVTAFGTGSSKQRVIDRLNSGADEPTAEIPIVEIEAASPSLHDELDTDSVSEEEDPMLEAILALIVVVVLVVVGRNWLKKRTAEHMAGGAATEETTGGARTSTVQRAPVSEFHVVGSEARVTFDVPLDDEDDEVLNEILVDEAMEVLRDKKHTLPIADVHQVVVFAGRGAPREIARTKLPSPGVLPPPPPVSLLHLGNVAPDPFKADADSSPAATYETKSQVPADELPPIGNELKIPKGLQRGLRAAGVDIDRASGPEIILGLLKLFGYQIEASHEPGVFNAIKDGETTLVVVEGYSPGDHPEVDEGRVRAFAGRFTMSGAKRGVFVSEKYAPFMIYDIERNEPRLRFLTRERLQEFIDSMAIS